MQKLEKLIVLLESFEKGYISPSCAMAIKDAREMLVAQDDEIKYLQDKVFQLESQLINTKIEVKLAEKVPPKKRKGN